MMLIPNLGIRSFAYEGYSRNLSAFSRLGKVRGALYPDWYKNTGSGYRNTQNIIQNKSSAIYNGGRSSCCHF